MRKQERITAIVVGLLFVFTSACVSAKETLTFWYYSDVNQIQPFVDDFEKENPDIDVEVVSVAYTSTYEKWIVAAAGGALPDVSVVAVRGSTNVLGGFIEPLDKWAAKTKSIKPSNFFPINWEVNVVDGQLMGLPFRVNSQLVFYDKQVFAEVGIGQPPRTWDELAQYAARLTKRNGDQVERWGFSFRKGNNSRTVGHFTHQNGWLAFGEDFKQSYYTDSKIVQTLTYLTDMVARGTTAIVGMPGIGNLAGGKVAMLNTGPWEIADMYKSNPGLELGGFQLPKGPSGAKPYALIQGESLVMFNTSEHKEAAMKLMEYLTYTRNGDFCRSTGSYFPVAAYAARERHWAESEVWRAVMENFVEGRIPPMNPPVTPASAALYSNAINEILGQKKGVLTALQEVHKVALDDLRNPALIEYLSKLK